MARLTLTLEDNTDGGVSMRWEFDAPLPEEADQPATMAQTIAIDLNSYLSGHADIEGESAA